MRAEEPAIEGVTTFDYHPAVGATFGIFPAGGPQVLPADQRGEEAYSAVFTGPMLAEPLEILGRPRAILHLSTSDSVVTFVARLCDVAPNGSSALVTKGVLNATHRESHADPSPLDAAGGAQQAGGWREPGQWRASGEQEPLYSDDEATIARDVPSSINLMAPTNPAYMPPETGEDESDDDG